MLLLTAGIVFAILDCQLWFRWSHLLALNSSGKDAQEKKRLEDKLGYLSVFDTRASFYVAVPTFEPMTFVTCVYIAKEHRARTLVLSMKPNGADWSQWSQWEKSIVFPIDWTGYHTVRVQLKKTEDHKWDVVVQDGDSKWEVPLDPPLPDFLEPGAEWNRTVWTQHRLEFNHRSRPSAIKLLAIDAFQFNGLQKSFNPTNGLHIWIE